ncbi:MAG: GYF domain-containing protein [Minicystis sp.]
MTARDLWRWTDERGVQRLVSTDELRAALAGRVLPASTLVWREGMKEWAPASSLPELASAAFAADAAGGGNGAKHEVADEDSFDARSTLKESARRATLIGLTSPAAEPADAPALPVEVPAVGERPPRPAVTQIPPFGAPGVETRAPAPPKVPSAPAIPPMPAPGAGAAKAAEGSSRRKPMTSDIDGLWATTTHSDEDETLPRRPRPSELAAAAAAAAEALRVERAKARAEAQGKPADAARVSAARRPELEAKKAGPETKKPGPETKKPETKKPDTDPKKADSSTTATERSATARPDAARAFATKPPHLPPTRARVAAASGNGPTTEPTGKTAVAPLKTTPLKPMMTTLTGVGAPVLPGAGATGAGATAQADAGTQAGAGATAQASAGTQAQVGVGAAAKPPPLPPPRPVFASGPLGVPVKPVVAPIAASVRVKPPPMPGAGPETITGDSRTMPATSLHATTLMGVAAPALPPQDAKSEAPGTAEKGARAKQTNEVTTTMVSPTDAIAQVEAAAIGEPVAAATIAGAEPEKTAPPKAEPAVATAAAATEVEAAIEVEVAAESVPGEAAKPAARDEESTATMARPERDEAAKPDAAARAPEAFGPLPPPRPPTPSKPYGRLPEPSRPPRRQQPAVAEMPLPPAATPVPSAVTPAPPASMPAPASMSAPPPSMPVPASVAPSRPPPSMTAFSARRSLVAVPVSSLLGAGGVLIGMVVAAFFVGRASAVPPPRLVAKPSMAVLPTLARAALPPPPKPCWMVKQPAMWAPKVSKSIPFDVIPTKGDGLAIGYARDAKTAVGIEVSLASGDIQGRFQDKTDDDVERVVPTPAAEFLVTRAGAGGTLKSPIELADTKSFSVGVADGSVAMAPSPAGTPSPLWPLEGNEGLGAAALRAAGERGYVLTFRRAGAVWGGWIGADRKASGELTKVTGSGGAVGKPAAGWNGREVAVIFADRPEADGRYEIRIGHAPFAKMPATTTVLPLPKGGPGGDAFAPEIAGLPDGRWVIMWTEGAAGSRAVRAQTLTSDFAPLGDPIALSPPAGNYGQGVIGVAGGYAATVFLSKGSSSYELWGSVLQCL